MRRRRRRHRRRRRRLLIVRARHTQKAPSQHRGGALSLFLLRITPVSLRFTPRPSFLPHVTNTTTSPRSSTPRESRAEAHVCASSRVSLSRSVSPPPYLLRISSFIRVILNSEFPIRLFKFISPRRLAHAENFIQSRFIPPLRTHAEHLWPSSSSSLSPLALFSSRSLSRALGRSILCHSRRQTNHQNQVSKAIKKLQKPARVRGTREATKTSKLLKGSKRGDEDGVGMSFSI